MGGILLSLMYANLNRSGGTINLGGYYKPRFIIWEVL